MKKFMQMLLASFGILALMLAGCSTGGEVDSGDDDSGDAVIENGYGEGDAE